MVVPLQDSATQQIAAGRLARREPLHTGHACVAALANGITIICAPRLGLTRVQRFCGGNRAQSLASLPDDWDGLIAPESTRFIGDNWAKSRSSLLLRVPSVVVIGEWNYLFNPDHPNMRDLHIGNPEPFRFDSRLR